MDNQSEGTIQTLKDMLRAIVLNIRVSWNQYLPLAEFAYNNNYQATISMALYEALYGRWYRLPIGWLKVGEWKLLGLEMVQEAEQGICVIRERMLTAQSR